MSSLGIDLKAGLGSGSVSVSSVSSSGSSDDQVQLGVFSIGIGDTKIIPQPRSPGPGSRVATANTSPRRPRFSGTSLDSAGKLEDGRSEFHPLPLPPGSPTSPSTLPNPRTSAVVENSHSNLTKWKKGASLLGRDTFGHVYLGLNSESGQMCAIKEVRVAADDQTSKECLKQLNQEMTSNDEIVDPNEEIVDDPESDPEENPVEDPEEDPKEGLEEDKEENQIVSENEGEEDSYLEVEEAQAPEEEVQASKRRLNELEDMWTEEKRTKMRLHNITKGLEERSRRLDYRLEKQEYAFRESFKRLQKRIEDYPSEEGQDGSRLLIDRYL